MARSFTGLLVLLAGVEAENLNSQTTWDVALSGKACAGQPTGVEWKDADTTPVAYTKASLSAPLPSLFSRSNSIAASASRSCEPPLLLLLHLLLLLLLPLLLLVLRRRPWLTLPIDPPHILNTGWAPRPGAAT